MDQIDEKITLKVTFGVRNDKNRGTLIETVEVKGNEYFFRFQDQPVARHCEQVQREVRKANVKRSRKITVDITSFSHEYFWKDKVTFKGTTLNSVNDQIAKACNTNINKEVGNLKRSITIAANKPKKIENHNQQIMLKLRDAETYFQLERARRIHELYAGPVQGAQNVPVQAAQGGSVQGAQDGPEQGAQGGPQGGGVPDNEDVELPSDGEF